MRVLSEIPDLAMAIDRKDYLIRYLGHRAYTRWRCTKAGRASIDFVLTVSRVVADTIDTALMSLGTPTEREAVEVIHEALVAAMHWVQRFDKPLLTASAEFSNPTLLRRLLATRQLLTNSAVAEFFSAEMSRRGTLSLAASAEIFQFEQLGPDAYLMEPLLVFLWSNLLTPFVDATGGALNVPTLSQIDALGGDVFLSFAYHWAPVVYSLAVVAPPLLLRQRDRVQCRTGPEILPVNLLVELIKVESLLHPMTHARMVEMWTDVNDMSRSGGMKDDDVISILKGLGDVTLRCLLTHTRRDNPVWTARATSFCDAGGREAYIDQCQDCVVTLRALYEDLEQGEGNVVERKLTDAFLRAAENPNDAPLAASCLLALEAILESELNFRGGVLVEALTSVCTKTTGLKDPECVTIVANLAKKLGVFLTEPEHIPVWTGFLQCLMAVFDVAPRLCAAGIRELCDWGGNLGLQQVRRRTDLILNFYSFIEETAQRLPQKRTQFDSLLWGALAGLIRWLPREEAPGVFAESLAATICQLAASTADDLETALLLRRLCNAIRVLNVSTGLEMPPLVEVFLCRLFFGPTGDDITTWLTIYRAAARLLDRPPRDVSTGLLIPAVDCSSDRNFNEVIDTAIITPTTIHNIATYLVCEAVDSCPLDRHPGFWDSIVTLTRGLLQREEIDASLCFWLGKILSQLTDWAQGESGAESAVALRAEIAGLPAASAIVPLIEQEVLSSFLAKTAMLPVHQWGAVFAPFFSLLTILVDFQRAVSRLSPETVHKIMSVATRALESPDGALQQHNLECLRRLLDARKPGPEVTNVVLQFYPELVRGFWEYSHLWDLQRLAIAAVLSEHIVRPPYLDRDPTEFLRLSQEYLATAAASGSRDAGLVGRLEGTDLHKCFELLRVVKGFRLRQLLVDLLKLGKGVETPDCLLSYEFVLEEESRPATATTTAFFVSVVDLLD